MAGTAERRIEDHILWLEAQNHALAADNKTLRAILGKSGLAAGSVSGGHATVHQHEETAAEFKALLAIVPVGVAIAHDSLCRSMTANKAFCEMLGVDLNTNPSKTGGKAGHLPFRVFSNDVEVRPEDLPMQVAAREGVTIEGSRCEIVRDDGKRVVIYGRVSPLFDEHGRPRGSVGAFLDMTERENLLVELQSALAQVKLLAGFLPICAGCKKIRDKAGAWHALETYISNHSEAEFTHGLCPTCERKFFEDETV